MNNQLNKFNEDTQKQLKELKEVKSKEESARHERGIQYRYRKPQNNNKKVN
jgi:hypothetical protein